MVIVKSGTRVHHLSTKLPQGNASKDYNVTIRVEIFDQEGASFAQKLTVKVRLCKRLLTKAPATRSNIVI